MKLKKLVRAMLPYMQISVGPEGGGAAAEKIDGEVTEQQLSDALAEGIEDVLGGEGSNDDGTSVSAGEEGKPDGKGEDEGAGKPDGEGTDEGAAGKKDEEGGDGDGTGQGTGDGTDDDEGAAGAEKLDYSMPEDLSERAQDRFTKLVDANKQKDEAIGQMTQTIQGMHQMVRNTGMSNEEFMDALDVMAMAKTKPEEGIKKLQGYIDTIARDAGIEVPSFEFDPLSDFPDLQRDVEDLKITKEYATTIAHQRRTQARTDKQTEENEQSEQRRQQWDTDRKTAIPKVGEYIESLQSDIDWPAKGPMLLKAAKYAREKLPPNQWVPFLKQEYDRITEIATSVAGDRGNGSEQPLMGNNSVRGGQKQPENIGDWIDQNL